MQDILTTHRGEHLPRDNDVLSTRPRAARRLLEISTEQCPRAKRGLLVHHPQVVGVKLRELGESPLLAGVLGEDLRAVDR